MVILLLVKLAAYSTFCKNNIQNHATQYVKLRNFPPISGKFAGNATNPVPEIRVKNELLNPLLLASMAENSFWSIMDTHQSAPCTDTALSELKPGNFGHILNSAQAIQ